MKSKHGFASRCEAQMQPCISNGTYASICRNIRCVRPDRARQPAENPAGWVPKPQPTPAAVKHRLNRTSTTPVNQPAPGTQFMLKAVRVPRSTLKTFVLLWSSSCNASAGMLDGMIRACALDDVRHAAVVYFTASQMSPQ